MIGDQWIYVGKSKKNLEQRIYDHSNDPRFSSYKEAIIEYCELSTSSDMDITETMLIKTMHPVINVVDSTDGSIPFVYDPNAIVWTRWYKKESDHRLDAKHEVIVRQYVTSYIEKRRQNICEYIAPIIEECNAYKRRASHFEFDTVISYWDLLDNLNIRYVQLKRILQDPVIILGYSCHFSWYMTHGQIVFYVICDVV